MHPTIGDAHLKSLLFPSCQRRLASRFGWQNAHQRAWKREPSLRWGEGAEDVAQGPKAALNNKRITTCGVDEYSSFQGREHCQLSASGKGDRISHGKYRENNR